MVVSKSFMLEFLSLADAIIIRIIIGVFGQIGDLVESLIKRDTNVKDAVVMPSTAVPAVIPDEQFIAEFAHMNLDPLRGLQFMVSINTGDRNKSKFLTTRVHGPYDFLEMVEEVGYMWEQQQHHAKVIILDKDRNSATRYLDLKTTDYIEAHWSDLVAEGILEEAIMKRDEPYTHTATILTVAKEDDPLAVKEPPPAPIPTPEDDEDDDL